MVRLYRKESIDNYLHNLYFESYSAYLEAQADFDKLREKLGDSYFNKWMKIKDKIGDKIKDPDWERTSPDEPVKFISNPDRKFKNIYDILKYNDEEIEELKDFLDNFQSKASKTKQDKQEGAKLIAEDDKYKVYRITDYKAAQNYGENTKWCITGRYDGNVEGWYDKYIKERDLDGGYYFYISKSNPREKYCVLVTKNNKVNSVWDAADRDLDFYEIPQDIVDVSKSLSFYDSLKKRKNNVWAALKKSTSFDEFRDLVGDDFDVKERNDWGTPLLFQLFFYFGYEVLKYLEEKYNDDDLYEILNLQDSYNTNIVGYCFPNIDGRTLSFLFKHGFDDIEPFITNYQGTTEKKDSGILSALGEYADLSSIEPSTLTRFLKKLKTRDLSAIADKLDNETLIRLADSKGSTELLDYLKEPIQEHEARDICYNYISTRPDIVIKMIKNGLFDVNEKIGKHTYIYRLLSDERDNEGAKKIIKYVFDNKKADKDKVLSEIETSSELSQEEKSDMLSLI